MNPRRTIEKAQAALQALGGPPAPRPPARKPSDYGLCKLCGHQVLYANTPRGMRMPLDRAPEGDLVVVDGTVREWGPLYADLARFCRHVGEACRRAQEKR